MSSVARRSQVLLIEERQNSTFIHTAVEYNKNSAEDVSDEQAVDAFSAGLCYLDLVEELGRIRPRTVSEQMEVANRFTNGEDAYNNKKGTFTKSRQSKQAKAQVSQ
jgi:hypothetical protein